MIDRGGRLFILGGYVRVADGVRCRGRKFYYISTQMIEIGEKLSTTGFPLTCLHIRTLQTISFKAEVTVWEL